MLVKSSPAILDQALVRLQRAIGRHGDMHGGLCQTFTRCKGVLVHPVLKGPWRSPSIACRRVAPSRYTIEAAVVHAAASQIMAPAHRIQVVSTPRFPTGVAEGLNALLKPYRKKSVAVAVISDAGGAYLHLTPWSIQGQWADDSESRPDAEAHPIPWNYTDAGQWGLKLLLLGPLRQPLWWQPPANWDGMLRSGAELARMTGIAAPTAYDLLRRLDAMKWISHRRGFPYRITRPEHVLQDWLAVARRRPPARIPIRPLFPCPSDAGDALAWMCRLAARLPTGVRWAASGWSACRIRKVVTVTDIEAYPVMLAMTGDLVANLESMECEVSDPGHAVAYVDIRTSRFAFHGVGEVGGVPAMDILQAAVDVVGDPARGMEQAEHIVDLVTTAYRQIPS